MTSVVTLGMRVVVAHDYLTQFGGAERVALELARRFDAERIVTSVYRPERTYDGFRDFAVQSAPSRVLARFGDDPRRALPVLPHAWATIPSVEADAVICSSSGWAHAVPVTAGTRKIVYCHNPARWLYQADDYLHGHSGAVRAGLGALRPYLRRWDRAAAASADVYVANSAVVAERIRHAYGVDAAVVHPPVCVDVDGHSEPVPAAGYDFYLTVARPRGYKGTQNLTEAFSRLPTERLVVVGETADGPHPHNVVFLGKVDEAQLRWLYANARALVSVSHEDFGLTPVEANAFGTPALVLRAGGFLETTQDGVSGSFIEDESADAVVRAVRAFPGEWDRAAVAANAHRFSAERFAAQMQEIVADAVAARHPHRTVVEAAS